MRNQPSQLLIQSAILLILLTACSAQAPAVTITHSPTPLPTQDLSGLSPDAITTLGSLEKLDDYPLFVMHFVGEYPDRVAQGAWPQGSDIACSLFATLVEADDMLFGRNFDWEISPALLLFTDPPDGYASVSMVDLTFLGYDRYSAASLSDLPLSERQALLYAPSIPFDGMNEYGLTIAMAAVPGPAQNSAAADPAKPTIGSISVIREVLDHARSVDEAKTIFQQYNLDFTGGPRIHYLLADPSGAAVLIEMIGAEMILLPNEAPWHMATNHLRFNAAGYAGCGRYKILSEQLSSSNGRLDPPAAMQLLSRVAQNNTQWSVVYDMTNGNLNLVVGRDYETLYPFHLDRVNP